MSHDRLPNRLARHVTEVSTDRRSLIQGATAAFAMGAGVTSLASSGQALAAQESGGTLIVAFDADPEILDPQNTTALIAGRVIALTNENLLSRGYDGSIQPGLAESWEMSEDGLTYTFTLKQGVKFHSGKDFTSEDVKYTFERWKANESSPTAYTIDPIDTIEAPDPHTVVFNLSEPYNIFLDQLVGAWSVILNQEAVEEAGDNYGIAAVDGTGPFKFVSWDRNQRIVFERFDDYTWGAPIFDNPGPAYLDGVEIRIIPEAATRMAEFQSGNVHIVQNVPSADVARLQGSPDVTIVEYAQLQTRYLGMNMGKTPTDDVAVRQAVNYAINRDDIVQGAYFGLGTPAYTQLHPETPGFWQGALEAAPSYDPDHARELLEGAGWVEGDDGIREKDGTRLSMPFWVINSSESVLEAQIIEQQLAEVGIEVETIQYEESAWFEAARSGDQVAFTIGVFYDNADNLYFYFHSRQMPAPNRFSYDDPEIDAWLDASRSDPDPAAVTEAYEGVQRRLIEDAPTAPLVHLLGTLGQANSVQGVKVHPSRWLYRMQDISLA
jgi:peptide/nickel transport system substrate-binding protein